MEAHLREVFLRENPGISEESLQMANPLSLAFFGDGVYELFVRGMLMDPTKSAAKLHRLCREMVKATAQSQALEKITPYLSEKEMALVKRGRNAHPKTSAKNASVGEYRRATGLECLFGALFLEGEISRLEELFHIIVKEGEEG